MLSVMGLDLAIGTSGACLPDGSTHHWTSRGSGDDRLNEQRDYCRLLWRNSRADVVVMEDIQGNLKGAAAKVIPMLHGAVRSALLDDGIPYTVVNAQTLKVFAVGKGGRGSDKAAMMAAAMTTAGRWFTDDNECDAWWLWLMAQHHWEQAPALKDPVAGPRLAALGVPQWCRVNATREA